MEPLEAPPKFPALQAVCRDDPATLVVQDLGGPVPEALAGLQALHLAAALGRTRCVRILLDAGVDPSPCTVPPTPPLGEAGVGADGGEPFSSYESVCSSPLYRELKELLPGTSEFSHTYTLAQLLLRGPCTPLTLAVRFGRQVAARMLLGAIEQRQRQRAVRAAAPAPHASNPRLVVTIPQALIAAAIRGAELDSALAVWSASPDPALSLLRRLLAAGGDPLPAALPAMLQRYSTCSHSSAVGEKMKAGLQSVLEHALPDPRPHSSGSSSGASGGAGIGSSGSSGSSDGGGESAGGVLGAGVASAGSGAPDIGPRSRPGCRVLCCAEHLRSLLAAAVACRDVRRCEQVLEALQAPGLDAAPWAPTGGNSSLLVSAAAHDMERVVRSLLAMPPVHEGGTPPFQPNMWGEDGLSALMAAAQRGALGALGALLEAGATVNLADELGATALHWAVVGGQEAAVLLLAQHGAAVDQAATVHEEEEHLERPLLTAIHGGNLTMARLLHQLGASLDLPSAGGYTSLSVSICWEQEEAARLLLGLGANPNQVLPPDVNGGQYQMWSENYSVEEARTLLGMACSRMDWRVFVELLLAAGADPTLRHPQTGLTPAAEVASFGALEEAALLFELSAPPAGPHSLEQLGWAEAMSEAARSFYFYSSATHPSDDASLEPLLDAWRQQQAQPGAAPPPAACRSIVAALLDHPALRPKADGSGQLAGGAELSGVLQAERLAAVGICADLLDTLETSPCKSVVLAAAPPAQRWSPARHTFFPPAFKHTARALLLANRRLLAGASGKQQLVLREGSIFTEELLEGNMEWLFSELVRLEGASDERSGGSETDHSTDHSMDHSTDHSGSGGCGTAGGTAGGEGHSARSGSSGDSSGGAMAEGLPQDVLGLLSGTGAATKGDSIGSSSSSPLQGLPRDTVFEVLRHLAAAPLSFWMRQPAAQARARAKAQGCPA